MSPCDGLWASERREWGEIPASEDNWAWEAYALFSDSIYYTSKRARKGGMGKKFMNALLRNIEQGDSKLSWSADSRNYQSKFLKICCQKRSQKLQESHMKNKSHVSPTLARVGPEIKRFAFQNVAKVSCQTQRAPAPLWNTFFRSSPDWISSHNSSDNILQM